MKTWRVSISKSILLWRKLVKKIERNTLGLEEQGVVHRSFQHEPYFSIEHEFSKTAFIEAREVVGVLLFLLSQKSIWEEVIAALLADFLQCWNSNFFRASKFFTTLRRFFICHNTATSLLPNFPNFPRDLTSSTQILWGKREINESRKKRNHEKAP